MLKNGTNEPKYKFPEPNPFVSEEEDGEVASVGYRYRKWNLNNGVVSNIILLTFWLLLDNNFRIKQNSDKALVSWRFQAIRKVSVKASNEKLFNYNITRKPYIIF